jgi:hypothetical protein
MDEVHCILHPSTMDRQAMRTIWSMFGRSHQHYLKVLDEEMWIESQDE